MKGASSGFVLRGVHVLWALLAFFGAILAVNVAFTIIALRTFPGEDVRRSYLQGLQYNSTLAERREQAALGWRATALLRPGAPDAVLEVNLVASDGSPLTSPALSGSLQRPTDARLDRQLAFEQIAPGQFVAAIADLPPGAWRLRARAENGDGALDFEASLRWPASP